MTYIHAFVCMFIFPCYYNYYSKTTFLAVLPLAIPAEAGYGKGRMQRVPLPIFSFNCTCPNLSSYFYPPKKDLKERKQFNYRWSDIIIIMLMNEKVSNLHNVYAQTIRIGVVVYVHMLIKSPSRFY